MTQNAIVEIIRQHPKLIIAEDFEITVKTMLSRSTRWLDDVPVSESNDHRTQVCLRISHRRKPGLSTTTELTPSALAQVVEDAFCAAEMSREDPWFRLPLWRKESVKPAEALPAWQLRKTDTFPNAPGCLEESAVERMGETLMVRKTEKAERRATTHWQRVGFQLPLNIGETTLLLTDEIAGAGVLEGVIERKKQLFLTAEALLAGVEVLPALKGSALFSPQAMAPILRSISKWFCADVVQAGTSPLTALKKPGGWQNVFSKVISISDDARLPWGELREPFDAEGSLGMKTELVVDGVPRGFLYDSYSSAKDNRLTTANYWIPDGELYPRITPTAFFIENGANALQQDLKERAWVQQMDQYEMHSPTQFSARLMGLSVQSGKSKAFVTDKLSFDIIDLMRHATLVGNDAMFINGFGSPSIFFEKLP